MIGGESHGNDGPTTTREKIFELEAFFEERNPTSKVNYFMFQEFEIGIWTWNSDLEFGIGIRTWNLELKFGIRIRNWNSELEFGSILKKSC